MNKMNVIADRLIGVQCPTGELLDRVTNAFVEENPDLDRKDIFMERSEEDDKGSLKAYRAYGYKTDSNSIIIQVSEGLDHYVAKIVDAYTH